MKSNPIPRVAVSNDGVFVSRGPDIPALFIPAGLAGNNRPTNGGYTPVTITDKFGIGFIDLMVCSGAEFSRVHPDKLSPALARFLFVEFRLLGLRIAYCDGPVGNSMNQKYDMVFSRQKVHADPTKRQTAFAETIKRSVLRSPYENENIIP